MRIYDALKADHRHVEQLFEQVLAADGDERLEIFRRLAEALTAHSKAERQVFYSRLLASDETRDLIRHAEEEHDQVEAMVGELTRLDVGDPQWEVKCLELQRSVEAHVQEEENEMFEKARDVLGADVEDHLGERFQQQEEREMERFEQHGL